MTKFAGCNTSHLGYIIILCYYLISPFIWAKFSITTAKTQSSWQPIPLPPDPQVSGYRWPACLHCEWHHKITQERRQAGVPGELGGVQPWRTVLSPNPRHCWSPTSLRLPFQAPWPTWSLPQRAPQKEIHSRSEDLMGGGFGGFVMSTPEASIMNSYSHEHLQPTHKLHC